MTANSPEQGRQCAHCRLEVRGYASIDDKLLCHPDVGIDCYRLVTVYGHPMPCIHCRDARMLMGGIEDELERLAIRAGLMG